MIRLSANVVFSTLEPRDLRVLNIELEPRAEERVRSELEALEETLEQIASVAPQNKLGRTELGF